MRLRRRLSRTRGAFRSGPGDWWPPGRVVSPPAPPNGRIDDVIQSFSEETEANRQEDDDQAGKEGGPPDSDTDAARSRGEVQAPVWRGGLDSESKVAQTRRREDGIRGAQRENHRDRNEYVRRDVSPEDPAGRRPERTSGFDVQLLPGRRNVAPCRPELQGKVKNRTREANVHDSFSVQNRNRPRQRKPGKP